MRAPARGAGMGSDWLPFGILGRPHGTHGEIHLRPYSGAPAARLEVPSTVRVGRTDTSREMVLVAARQIPDGYLARFDGMADRESVARLSGEPMEVLRRALAPLAAAEFYVEDLLGCDVLRTDGVRLGRVAGTFWNGAQDVMSVRGDDGEEYLVPVVADYVLHFDPERRQLIVDPHD